MHEVFTVLDNVVGVDSSIDCADVVVCPIVVRDDSASRTDPSLNDRQQSFCLAVRHWDQSTASRFALDCSKHPTMTSGPPTIVFCTIEHAFVDLDDDGIPIFIKTNKRWWSIGTCIFLMAQLPKEIAPIYNCGLT